MVLSLASAPANAEKLRVTTFNIAWYGAGGRGFEDAIPEYRDSYLRDFIRSELRYSDVIVFQEIVDVARFERNVIGNFMDCQSYNHGGYMHQHVVLCHKPEYKFYRESFDNNWKLE
ncbi:MAG: hypothetical protein KDD43_12645, partial [Bdellovibrionales bacterium]|nr:hypothetical protein [Bdellovibrionales bacterium]